MKFTQEQLQNIAEQDIPHVNLWQSIETQINQQQGSKTMKIFEQPRKLIYVTLLMALMVVAVSPVAVGAAQTILREIGGIKLTSEPIDSGQPQDIPDDVPVVPAPPKNIFSIEQVSEMEGFAAYQITDVPTGYTLVERDAARKGETKWIRTSYSRTDEADNYLVVTLTQTSWGTNLPEHYGEWNMGNAPIEDVTVRGVDGVFVDGAPILYTAEGIQGLNVLIWAEDGFSFTLVADEFSKDELLQIAASMTASE